MTLRVTLSATVDRAVTFTVTVTNVGSEPRALTFRSGLLADVAAFERKTAVWRWSDGRFFTQALSTESLAAGESVTYERVWEHPEPGMYTAIATLRALEEPLQATTRFVVPRSR